MNLKSGSSCNKFRGCPIHGNVDFVRRKRCKFWQNYGLTFDPYTISEVFKKIISNLANNLVQKFPAAAKKFGNKSLEEYYNDMFNLNPKKLHFQTIQTRYI